MLKIVLNGCLRFFFFYKVEAVLYENDLDSLESPEAWREPGAPGPPSPIAIPAWC